jgi:hypothetical protein
VPGDYDKSGLVDQADYNLWRSTFGSTVDLRADGNGDNVVDAADYSVWRDNLGVGLGSVASMEDNSQTLVQASLPEALTETKEHLASQATLTASDFAVGMAPQSSVTTSSAPQPVYGPTARAEAFAADLGEHVSEREALLNDLLNRQRQLDQGGSDGDYHASLMDGNQAIETSALPGERSEYLPGDAWDQAFEAWNAGLRPQLTKMTS